MYEPRFNVEMLSFMTDDTADVMASLPYLDMHMKL